jgi:predicted nuclease of predicted toxin-antitoxin system
VPTFLVDEDLPRSLAPQLRLAGFACEDVRDVGLATRSDEQIAAYALAQGRVVITRDVRFANQVQQSAHTSPGIVVVRFPNVVTTSTLNSAVATALRSVGEAEFAANVVVIEPGRLRLRRRRGQPRA